MGPRTEVPILIRALVIIAAVLAIYWPALDGGPLWDDNLLITSNARLHTLAGLGRIWFAAPTTDYWPLTWTLLWLEWHLWGNVLVGYHLVSVALHITSALLLWRILSRLGLRHAWLGGLLFAVHPLAVESVAWMSEIKNTLSLPLFLLAFDAWLDDDAGRTGGHARSVVYFALAMLAKTSTVTLPLVLLLYTWWKRSRITLADVRRVAPHLTIALALGLITVFFQDRPNSEPIEPRDPFATSIFACTAVCFYLGKFLVPLDLVSIYPAWGAHPRLPLDLLAPPLFVGLLLGLGRMRKASWARHAIFGLGFFLITLAPVLGFIRMEYLHFSPVADHLVYLPMIGLVALVAALLDLVVARFPILIARASLAVAAIAVFSLAWTSRAYASLYADPLTFWVYTAEHNPRAWPAFTGIGNALLDAGRPRQAFGFFEHAIALKPDDAEAHYDLANAEFRLGRTSGAINDYLFALVYNPRDAQAHYNLANALLQSGRVDDAITQYQFALDVIPESAEIRGNYAQALLRAGRTADALDQFRQAAQLDPASAIAAFNFGLALEQTGQTAAALAQFQRALQLDPRFAPAQKALARVQAAPKN